MAFNTSEVFEEITLFLLTDQSHRIIIMHVHHFKRRFWPYPKQRVYS